MDRLLVSFLVCTLCPGALVTAQYSQTYQSTTPVPILKQIDRHNEDGSYSYGYEAADGSFKIESKYPTGEVYGKYGFVDDTGKVREVEYGATQRGFEPAGTDINVPPSTIQGNSVAGPNDPEDDGQYREDPSIYHTDPKYTNGEYYRPVAKRPNQPIQSAYRPSGGLPQRYDMQAANAVQTQPQYQSAYQQQYQQEYQPQDDQVQYQQPFQYQRARSYQPRYDIQQADVGSYPTDYSQ